MNKTSFCRPMVAKEQLSLLFLVCLAYGFGCPSQFSQPAFAGKTKPVIELVEDRRPRADVTRLYNAGNKITIAIEHVSGISKAELVLKDGQWPRNVQIQFRHFKAIDGIKIITASKRFEASVSTLPKDQVIELKEDFTATRKEDSIVIDAPQNFLKEKEKSMRIEWIDYYRN